MIENGWMDKPISGYSVLLDVFINVFIKGTIMKTIININVYAL